MGSEQRGGVRGIRRRALAVLEAAWDPQRRYCFPNRTVYPHLWLWDSCFHAIAWAALGDSRGVTELGSALAGRLSDGFVPHMRYAGETIARGPLPGVSSFTQPPVYAHAAVELQRRGFTVPDTVADAAGGGLEWLFEHRMTESGLLKVVHPWETGADDSPRWDDWVGSAEWNRPEWTQFDFDVRDATTYASSGAAIANTRFEAAPAAFNAIAAHGAMQLGGLAGDHALVDRGFTLAEAIDAELWNEREGLWSDCAVTGGGASVHVPTLDGVLPALVTRSEVRARRALRQLTDPGRFFAPFGLTYVAKGDARYRGDGYWRGSAWMQLHYLIRLAALRWDDAGLAGEIAQLARRGAVASEFAEHWNPDTGEPAGAVPQTWSALVAAL